MSKRKGRSIERQKGMEREEEKERERRRLEAKILCQITGNFDASWWRQWQLWRANPTNRHYEE